MSFSFVDAFGPPAPHYRLHELVGGPAAGHDAPQDWLATPHMMVQSRPTTAWYGEFDTVPPRSLTEEYETYSIKTIGGPFGRLSFFGHDQSTPKEVEKALWEVLLEAAGCTTDG